MNVKGVFSYLNPFGQFSPLGPISGLICTKDLALDSSRFAIKFTKSHASTRALSFQRSKMSACGLCKK